MGEVELTKGKIIKGIAGFYYVHTPENKIYECKAKGIFRKEKQKPLVGDEVMIDIISREERTGNVVELLPRKNELIRPAVANIDQALVIFAAASPAPNFQLLDKFLVLMKWQQVGTIICFNKMDLATEGELDELKKRYERSGSRLVFTCAREGKGLEELQELLAHRTTTVAGPSGVGKSSLINRMQSEVRMETGTISEKTERGKHTTRHAQLICIQEDTYIVDTPGFTSLYVEGMKSEELAGYFPEFTDFEPECRFLGCSHTHEPDCGVKEALLRGAIHRGRYESYVSLYNELKEIKRY